MTARNPLFEFMPYGAPELLAAQRPHLLRALALASALALAVFVLARSLGLSFTPAAPIVVDIPQRGVHVAPPPSILTPPAPAVASVTVAPPRISNSAAVPIPVPEDVVAPPAAVSTPSLGLSGTGSDHAQPGEPDASSGTASFGDDPLPEPNTYVYRDEMPVAVKLVEPKYPDMARELGIGGRVYVLMLVGKDGRVVRAQVDEKQSVPVLDEAALAAARQCVFKPALANNHPVAVWVGEMFVFTMHY